VRSGLLVAFLLSIATLLALVAQNALNLPIWAGVYFAVCLVVAAWLGRARGLVAALAAALLAHLFFPQSQGRLDALSEQDLGDLIIFVAGAWIAGFYTAALRKQREALLRMNLIDAARAGPAIPAVGRPGWRGEILGLGYAVVLTACAVGISVFARDRLGIERLSAIFLSAVVVAAIALGARFALVTAILSALSLDYFIVEPLYAIDLGSGQSLLNFTVFLGTAWWVGAFAEGVRQEREAVRTLFSAGRTLSATADVQDLLVLLADLITAASGGGQVRIEDAEGDLVAQRPADAAPGWPGPDEPLLREKVLEIGGRIYGRVVWSAAGVRQRARADTIEALVDLAAAAVARSMYSHEKAAVEALAQSEELRRALLASVSHDLRTPLAGILGSATSLIDYADAHDESVRRDLLENIRQQADRLDRYVANLLGMTRLEAGALQPDLETVTLAPLVAEVVQPILETYPGRRVRLDLTSDLAVIADHGLLAHAFGNVFENAVKFGARTGEIHVRGQSTDAGVELVVRDDGPGVAEADLPNLFQPFFRGAGARGGGVGLGLFIAHNFVVAMHGEVWASRRSDRPGLEVGIRLRPAAAP
jgi:two-component system sensor histidine kinase KdpD